MASHQTPRRAAIAAGLAFLLAATAASAARAADLVVFCSNALQSTLTDLVPDFEKATGKRLLVTYASSAPLKTRIDGGDAFDVAILTPSMIADLGKTGKAAAASIQTIAKAEVALAIRKGAPRPDIATPEGLKAALLATPSLASSAAGQSRVALLAVLDTLGIAAEVNAKTKLITAGSAGEALLHGEAEMAVQLMPELMAVPGIDVAGPFPPSLQNPVILTAAIATAAKDPAGAAALLAFLASPDAIRVMRAKGLTPG